MRFRVVVVGAGAVSRFWLPPLLARPDTTVVGLVEPDAGRARAVIAEHRLNCLVDADLETAIADTGANLVANLSPPAAHRAVVETALELGCDVLGEKPMAATLEDAAALVRIARRTGRTFAVMQNRRFHPAIRRLREGIAAGAIGEPVLACADMFLAPHFDGNTFLQSLRSPLLLDMAIHTFDQARYVTGAEPLAVFCHELDPGHSWFAGAAAAVCTFELTDGVVFSYRGSWVSNGFPTSYDAAWRIAGTRGTAIWDSAGDPACEAVDRAPRSNLYDDVVREPWPVTPARDRTGHAAALDALLDAIATGRPPETDCSDNVVSLAMVFAALRSAEQQRVVPIAEVLEEAAA